MRNIRNRRPVLDEQLAFLSVKYNVYLTELFEAIVLARKTGQAVCQDLKIEYRGSVAGQAIFKITKEGKVLVQFRASEERLLKEHIDFERCMGTEQVRKEIARQDTASCGLTAIQNLRHGMKKVQVEAKVIEMSKPVQVHTQFGNNVMLTNAWVADETGKIKVALWNEQACSLKVGDSVNLNNVSVTTFRHERQLRLGSKGTINVIQRVIAEIKSEITESHRDLLFT